MLAAVAVVAVFVVYADCCYNTINMSITTVALTFKSFKDKQLAAVVAVVILLSLFLLLLLLVLLH